MGEGATLLLSLDGNQCDQALKASVPYSNSAISFSIADVVSNTRFHTSGMSIPHDYFAPWEAGPTETSGGVRIGPATPRAGQGDLEGWRGIFVTGRFFAWDGPGLHGLPEWAPVPEPPGLISALRQAGMTASFGIQERVAKHLASGRMQVLFETDRLTYRRAIVGGGSGESQLLLVRPNSSL